MAHIENKKKKKKRRRGYLSECANRQSRGAFNNLRIEKPGVNPKQPDVCGIM